MKPTTRTIMGTICSMTRTIYLNAGLMYGASFGLGGTCMGSCPYCGCGDQLTVGKICAPELALCAQCGLWSDWSKDINDMTDDEIEQTLALERENIR
jgi:hypothetical protein